ncbi:hypothetical protein HOB10_03585 [Candidatus Parcubacteria bacterium]|jgi:hypothetical protein|nr:hypothetical protein [Candidatus Parcubacteria bacterium]
MNDYKPLTTKELERGYFFLTHKGALRKMLFGAGIFVVVIVYIILLINAIGFVQKAGWQHMAMGIGQGSNWAARHAQGAPMPILTKNVQALSLGDRRYALVAFIENPNEDWAARSFKYRFVVDGQALPEEEAFMNPSVNPLKKEERMLIKFGYESSRPPSDVRLDVDAFQWRRYENDSPVINWDVLDIRYYAASRESLNGNDVIVDPHVDWWAQNLSLYDLWEAKFQIALFNGDRLVGVNEILSKDFISLQKKELEVIWLNDLSRVTTTKVYPVVNWLDYDNFKALEYQPRGGGSRVEL